MHGANQSAPVDFHCGLFDWLEHCAVCAGENRDPKVAIAGTNWVSGYSVDYFWAVENFGVKLSPPGESWLESCCKS